MGFRIWIVMTSEETFEECFEFGCSGEDDPRKELPA